LLLLLLLKIHPVAATLTQQCTSHNELPFRGLRILAIKKYSCSQSFVRTIMTFRARPRVSVTGYRRHHHYRQRRHWPCLGLVVVVGVLVTALWDQSDGTVQAFVALRPTTPSPKRCGVSSSSSFDRSADEHDPPADGLLQKAVSNVTRSVSTRLSRDAADEASLERELDRKKQTLASRRLRQQQSSTVATGWTAEPYTIRLPLPKDSYNNNNSTRLGLSLAQVIDFETLSPVTLNVDRLVLERSNEKNNHANGHSAKFADSWSRLDSTFRGIVVSRVQPGSLAAQQGVQIGDIVHAVSATWGDAVWPQSTLEGIASALTSRQTLARTTQPRNNAANTVRMDLQRPVLPAASSTDRTTATVTAGVRNQFELTLPRPLGIDIDERDGYVVVTGFEPTASTLVRMAVQVGDRVVAVDSSLGGTMWPVSTVQGVQSACTGRLPGKPVTLRFERPVAQLQTTLTYDDATGAVQPTVSQPPIPRTSEPASTNVAKSQPVPDPQTLLARCRDVLERYAVEHKHNQRISKSTAKESTAARFKDKYGVPAIVADKVVDAVAAAQIPFDAVTLSMVLRAYLSVSQVDRALQVFEAATLVAADGSTRPVPLGQSDTTLYVPDRGMPNGGVEVSAPALNLYTATAALQAQARAGDWNAVRRLWSALQPGLTVNRESYGGLETARWAPVASVDTTCYNILLSAAERRRRDPEAFAQAEQWWEQMQDPPVSQFSTTADTRVVRDVVTYNTMMSVYCNAGEVDKALALLPRMRRVGLRPDKYTYTTLIKACTVKGDVQELLYDMKEHNVAADVVTYNTMIRALCEDRRWTQATRLVTEMECRGVSPDSQTYGLLMHAMLQADKPSACLALFESACASETSAALTENVYLYTTAVTAAAVLGNHERALELVSRMQANGIKPNLKTLTAVMGACLVAGQPDLAVHLYRKLEAPDGYAMYQGIRALCENGDVHEAAQIVQAQVKGNRVLSGKQMMMSYQAIANAALKSRDYNTARNIIRDLLQKKYIPNKSMILSMMDAMGLTEPLRRQRVLASLDTFDKEAAAPKFVYLLFLVDALRLRNLEIDGILYASILTLGSRLGGLPRKLAALLSRVRTQTTAKPMVSSDESSNSAPLVFSGWEDLYQHYDGYKEELAIGSLPPLPVRVSSREFRQVLRAEQTVAYRPSNKSITTKPPPSPKITTASF
jgi:pentatricopeptide repeat protein